jgi:hypothetical protein
MAMILSLSFACTSINTASTGSGISAAQATAGVEYLESTVAVLQKALDAAKITGDPAKVSQAQSVLDNAKNAAATFKASIPADQGSYDTARSMITTAVSVLGPIALQALVSGS